LNKNRMPSFVLIKYYSPFPGAILFLRPGCPRVTHPFAAFLSLCPSEEF
jgi:hypothetical protein